jgi:hypothetical protein
MIVQAIGLLDDLDKELNTYAMRVREWYGWHFPEMTKIVGDNIKYAQTVSGRKRAGGGGPGVGNGGMGCRAGGQECNGQQPAPCLRRGLHTAGLLSAVGAVVTPTVML